MTEYDIKVDYKVVSEIDKDIFNQQCKASIKDGWETFGRLHINNTKTGELIYSQAFCLVLKPERKRRM